MSKDFGPAAVWAGVTAFVWYEFGAVPLHIGVSQQLGLTTAQTSSWIFIVWFSGALASIALSLHFRQPIPVVPRRVVYESCSRKAGICAQLITAESLAG